MRQLFGTDGIRGQAGVYPMTAGACLSLAMAAAQVLAPKAASKEHRPLVVIGKDTRLSGYMIEPALTSGFIASGMDVVLLGPVPTPSVAMLTRSLRADLGVMITASHNPYADNGIKFFGADGYKLTDALEAAIEAQLDLVDGQPPLSPEAFGRASRMDDATGRIIEYAKGTFPRDLRLEGLKVVVDCAHGAAYKVAPRVLWELGAEVISIGVSPDGLNINRGCGALHLLSLSEYVQQHEADIGLAFDGDADRLVVVDETGAVIDGDQVLGLLAHLAQKNGTLKGGGIVATVMANMGLETYLSNQGLKLVRTKVGDRYVLEEMRRLGWSLGGESSGHLVLADYATTGDGLLAGLQILAELARTGQKASTLMNVFTPVPQALVNITVTGKPAAVLALPAVQAHIDEMTEALRPSGRVLVRASGTEALIRVMVEGEDALARAQTLAAQIQSVETCQA